MLQKPEVSKHPLFSLENLYQAYRKCRRHKRNTHNAMIFEQNLEENLFTEVTENCRFRKVRRQDFKCLPEHKTLFKASHGCGLPIGNLTSQFFANVYLDALDQFVKHQLKARFYIRYCDDLIHLGMKNFPAGRMVYPWPWILLERTRQCLNSYLAHFEKASCYRLIENVRKRYFWLGEYFLWQKGKVFQRCPIPGHAIRFADQKAWFKTHLPGHVLLIRQGGFWEFDVEFGSPWRSNKKRGPGGGKILAAPFSGSPPTILKAIVVG